MADVNGNLEQESAASTRASFREIITKAVCGTGKHDLKYSEMISVPAGRVPSSILGSSVTRLKLTEPLVTEISGDGSKCVRVSGTFDINIWYAYQDDQGTDVAKETIKFTELISIDQISESIVGPIDARAVLVKAPHCHKAIIAENNLFKVDVEFSIYAEIVGETKVFVQVYQDTD